MKNTKQNLLYLKNFVTPVLFLSIVVGFFAGLIVSLYNAGATLLNKYSSSIYAFVRANLAYLPLLFLGLAVLAFIVYFLLKKSPELKGSGIPQTEGAVRGLLSFRWLRVLINTIVISFLGFFAGLSLGSEGPSIQIGGTIGHGTNRLLGNSPIYKRYVLTGGASAGLAVAFNAPLTGIIFALEEAHKRFTPMILLASSVAVISGEIVANTLGKFWGAGNIMFDIAITNLPISNWWIFILAGIFCGVLGFIFTQLLIESKKKLDKAKKIPLYAKLLCAFLLTGIVGLLLSDVLGGGHHLVLALLKGDFAISMLLLLLVVKLLMTIICFNSGITGGLFIPMLAIGASFGGLFGKIAIACGLSPVYYSAIVLLCMVAFLGASVKAPLTSCVLAVELTGSFESFLPVCLIVFIAYFVAELFGKKPLYEELLDMNLKALHQNEQKVIYEFSAKVENGSFVVRKGVRDILWPANCLVVRVLRDNGEIIPDGETILKSNDTLFFRAETFNQLETADYVINLLSCETDCKINDKESDDYFTQQTIPTELEENELTQEEEKSIINPPAEEEKEV